MIYYLEQLMPRILRNTNKINKYFKECILFSFFFVSFFLIFIYFFIFLNFKIFNSYMRQMTK